MFTFPTHVWAGGILDPAEIGGGPAGGGVGNGGTLAVWWDATDSTKLFTDDAMTTAPSGDGDRVRVVENKGDMAAANGWAGSGTGAPSVDNDRPFYRPTGRNGRSALDFDSDTADLHVMMENDSIGSKLTDAKKWTVAVVAQIPALDAGDAKAPWGSTADSGTYWWFRVTANSGATRIRSSSNVDTLQTSGRPNLGTHILEDEWYLLIMTCTSDGVTGDIQLYYNNVQATTAPLPTPHDPETVTDWSGMSSIRWGASSSNKLTTDRFGWDAYQCHFMVYDEVFSSVQRAQLQTWANSEFALTDSITP
jgi:hypothetical protein